MSETSKDRKKERKKERKRLRLILPHQNLHDQFSLSFFCGGGGGGGRGGMGVCSQGPSGMLKTLGLPLPPTAR